MWNWIFSRSYLQVALVISAFMTSMLLVGGTLFMRLGYAHPNVTYSEMALTCAGMFFIFLAGLGFFWGITLKNIRTERLEEE